MHSDIESYPNDHCIQPCTAQNTECAQIATSSGFIVEVQKECMYIRELGTVQNILHPIEGKFLVYLPT